MEQNSSEDIVDKFNNLVLDKNRNEKSKRLVEAVKENFDLDRNIEYLEGWLIR